ncbi:hypothetical protein [Kutzneria sp. CA-103260]|uniref:hypothetical protein n=1 Tax=Kutzneria sp. CA-103260 TaxID=2802641 RepID=UPI001BAB76F2|nr:hypothetical protein [Kutzneria sp. CA-103260]QUQ65349.1 hypothetical protein JJ691_30720 [Kutzneria sp. CA-103260]
MRSGNSPVLVDHAAEPETVALRAQADLLVRHWDDLLAARIFAEDIDSRPSAVVSATTAADITWSIPSERASCCA